MDFAARWAETGSFIDATAKSVAGFFEINIMFRHKSPYFITSHNRWNFIAKLT
jgi:hypothetical protein